MAEPTQQTNETPWTQNLLEVFGFKNKAQPTQPPVQQSSGASGAIWERPEALWAMYSPKPPKQSFDSLFDRVIQQESRGRHTDESGNLTRSPVGALGVTQIMPKTGKNPGYGIAPLKDDSEGEYLRLGKELLQAYTKELGGDTRKGLAAYNAGIGRVQKLVDKHGDDWQSKLPSETKNYLTKILGK